MTLNHHIKQLRISLKVPDQETANDLQQAVSTFCRTDLDNLLQEVFDTISPDRWLRIDRLELGLPAFHSVDEFRGKLGERVRAAALVRINDATAASVAPETVPAEKQQTPRAFDQSYQAADAFIHMLKYGVAPWHATRAGFDEIVSRIIPLLKHDGAFRSQVAGLLTGPGPGLRRFILQTPAPDRIRIVSLITGTDDHTVAEAEKIADAVVTLLTRAGDSGPHTDLLASQTATCHLIQHRRLDKHSVESMLKEVTATLLQPVGDQGRQMLADLAMAGMQWEAALPVRWREMVRNTLTNFAARAHDRAHGAGGIETPRMPAGDPPDGWEQEKTIPESDTGKRHSGILSEAKSASVGDDLSKAGALPEKAMHASVDKRTDRDRHAWEDAADNSQSLPAGPSQALAHRRPSWGRTHSDNQRDKQSAVTSRGGTVTGRSIGVLADRPEPTALDDWMTPYDADAFQIHNAGLVLVAPFFRMVFNDLGYLEDGREFAADEARARAVHFSQYVVTARRHPAECDLILNKIICGMDVNAPMERFVDLTDRERAAAKDVLTSAIGHWTLLKRTSVAVFRQTFLQHDGILTGAGGNWLLRIERISADVLIDTLPWTISIIKHPWMQQAVMVEW